jgi:hypothetical protein
MLGIAAGAILVVIFFFVFYLRSQKTGILVLEPTNDITVTLNGRAASVQKTDRGLYVALYAGQYRLQLQKPGYLPFTQDVQTAPGNTLEVRPAFTILPSIQQTAGNSIDYVRPSADEHSLYYLGDYRQRLFRLEVSTQTAVPLTDKALQGVSDVQWGSNPDVALIVQTDGVYLHEIPRFDFEHQIYTKVAGPEAISPVWDPNNPDRIAAAYFPPSGERSLIITDKQFTNINRVATLTAVPTPKVLWSPDSNYLLLIARSADYAQQNLWMYTLANGNLAQLTKDGGVRDARFSPDSSKVLIEARSQGGQTTRTLLTLSDGSTEVIEGTTPLSHTAWKDASGFYEPSNDNQALLLRHVDGSSESTPLSLPKNEDIQTMFYYPQTSTLIISTRTAVYTVNLEKK